MCVIFHFRGGGQISLAIKDLSEFMHELCYFEENGVCVVGIS